MAGEKLVTQGILTYYHNKVSARNDTTFARKEDVPSTDAIVQALVESGATMTEADVDAMFDDTPADEGTGGE